MDTRCENCQAEDGTDSTAIENIMTEKHFGTPVFESNSRRIKHDKYKENDQVHN